MKVCSREGCHQWVIGTDEELCSYDAKVRDGLIVPDSNVYGRRWSQPRQRKPPPTINPSDVVTDEQLELAKLMRAMGANEQTIARAMEKDRHMPTSGSRKGTGVRHGKLVV
jgi:hypothetical protein